MPILVFRGLCAIADFGDGKGVQAVMPQGMGHQATLLVASNECDIETLARQSNALLRPNFVAFAGGRQFLGWTITNVPVTFLDGVGTASPIPKGERDRTLDLGSYQPGPPHAATGPVASVRLPAGALFASRGSDIYRVQPSNNIRQMADGIWWLGDSRILVCSNGDQVPLLANATVEITNEAADPKGYGHLHMYYDAFYDGDVPRISIEPAASSHHIDVYDCVPPTPLP